MRASQRERLLRAMLECVATDGWAATTIPRVAARARVSPNTFYAFFEDKVDCFLAVCDEEAERLLDELFRVGAKSDDWVEAVRLGTRLYLNWWRERPETSWAYLVELPSAGRRAASRRDQTYERFLQMFSALATWARVAQPTLPPVSTPALRILVAGITEVVAAEVRAHRLERLSELEDDVVRLTLSILADEETAERAIARATPRRE